MTRPTCPQCARPLAPDAPSGLCPACLLQQGMRATVETDRPGDFQAPTIEELSPLFPQLELTGLIGRGGMGAVYRARQTNLDRDIALKVLPTTRAADPSFAERFVREAQSLARLSHPHIVTIYDFGETEGLYYLIMEFVDGVNLRQLMEEGIDSAQALRVVPQICDALAFAHERGIVHRDIKPENILVGRDGHVKIADFGLAKLLDRAVPDVSLTGQQDVLGTLNYMAPEQLERPREVDHRADIYSLGVVFYELLTGELPLGRFDPPSERVQIDVHLDEVVLRALAKEPTRRYQSAAEMKTQILETPAPQPAGKSRGRKKERSGAGVAATLTLGRRRPKNAKGPKRAKLRRSPVRPRRLSKFAVASFLALPVPFVILMVTAVRLTQLDRAMKYGQDVSDERTAYLIAATLFAIAPSVLGTIAIVQIRRAAGALFGLTAAVLSALFYPLAFLTSYMLSILSPEKLSSDLAWLYVAAAVIVTLQNMGVTAGVFLATAPLGTPRRDALPVTIAAGVLTVLLAIFGFVG